MSIRTLFGELLARSNRADSLIGDVQEGSGLEAGEEVGDDARLGKVGLDGGNGDILGSDRRRESDGESKTSDELHGEMNVRITERLFCLWWLKGNKGSAKFQGIPSLAWQSGQVTPSM